MQKNHTPSAMKKSRIQRKRFRYIYLLLKNFSFSYVDIYLLLKNFSLS